jgi:hypothetical protein
LVHWLVGQLKELDVNGLEVFDSSIQTYRKIRPMLFLIEADTPQRAEIQQVLNFNGKHGCGECEETDDNWLNLNLYFATENHEMQPILGTIQQLYQNQGLLLNSLEKLPTKRNSKQAQAYYNEVRLLAESNLIFAAAQAKSIRQKTGYLVADFIGRKEAKQRLKAQGISSVPPLEISSNPLWTLYDDYDVFDVFVGCPAEPFHALILGIIPTHGKILFQQLNDTQREKVRFDIRMLSSERGIPSLGPCKTSKFWESWEGDEWIVVLGRSVEIFTSIVQDTNIQTDIKLWQWHGALMKRILAKEISNIEIVMLKKHYGQFWQQFHERYQSIRSELENKINFHAVIHSINSMFRFGPISLFFGKIFEIKHKSLRKQILQSNFNDVQRYIAHKEWLEVALRCRLPTNRQSTISYPAISADRNRITIKNKQYYKGEAIQFSNNGIKYGVIESIRETPANENIQVAILRLEEIVDFVGSIVIATKSNDLVDISWQQVNHRILWKSNSFGERGVVNTHYFMIHK